MNAQYTFCMVPGKTKAKAVDNTLNGKISEIYPSTILTLLTILTSHSIFLPPFPEIEMASLPEFPVLPVFFDLTPPLNCWL